MMWPQFRESFEREYVSGQRPNTRANYRATFDLFENLCQPGRLASITERTVSQFASGMRQRPTRGRDCMMSSTIRVRLQYLHTALAWAVEQKLLPAVPKFPSIKVPRKTPQPIQNESWERLFASADADQQMQAYLLCGWLAGLRLSEAFGLEWEPSNEAAWVDFCRNRIVLPAAAAKAGLDAWVPIDPALRSALDALPRLGRKVFDFRGPDNHPITAGAMSDRVALLAKRAGVKLTYHTLRKGFGCRYAGRVSAHVLQRLMRHADIKTTLAYYVSFDAAVEEAVFGGPVLRPQPNAPRNGHAESHEPNTAPDVLTLVPRDDSERLQMVN